jgi:hypothetical protein
VRVQSSSLVSSAVQVISGIGPINSNIAASNENRAIGNATVEPTGRWALTIDPGLPAGYHEILLHAFNANGQVSPEERIVVLVRNIGTGLKRWQNPLNAYDVNADGSVTPLDALIIINDLNRSAVCVLTAADPTPPYLDVNGDSSVTPIDALRIINFLNRNWGSRAAPMGSFVADKRWEESMILPSRPASNNGEIRAKRPKITAESTVMSEIVQTIDVICIAAQE